MKCSTRRSRLKGSRAGERTRRRSSNDSPYNGVCWAVSSIRTSSRILDGPTPIRIAGSDGGGGRRQAATHGDRRPPMTLAYASPEQVRGALITAATDVYALGTI